MLLIGCLFLLSACSNSDAPKPTANKPGSVNDILQQGMSQEDQKTKPDTESSKEESSDSESETDRINLQTSDSESKSGGEKLPTSDSKSEPGSEELQSTAISSDSDSDKIDVDLTVLTSTMVYSEVYNMVYYPEDYRGKTVKMEGQYLALHDDATGQNYFCCIIQDATACCSQGIEFILTDEYRFPEDYPVPNSNICVVGVFDTYEEGEYTYCTLRNAKLI